jgi:hypothetical protein
MYIKLLIRFVLLRKKIFSILDVKNRIFFYIDMALSIIKPQNYHQILKILNPWEYYVWKNPKIAIVQNRENCFILQSYCNKTLKICCPSYQRVICPQQSINEKDGFGRNTRKWEFYSALISIRTRDLITNKRQKFDF